MSKPFDRKFDEFKWNDSSEAGDRIYDFEVRMMRPENVAEGRITYYIKNADPPIDIQAHDLEKLRELLDTTMRAWLSVEWKKMLLVIFKWKGEEFSTTFTLEVTEFEEGIARRDGRSWFRQTKGAWGHYSSSGCAFKGKIEDAKHLLTSSDDADMLGSARTPDGFEQRRKNRAIVADTPENRAALSAIREGLHALAGKLRALLGRDKLAETLASVSVGRLLSVEPSPMVDVTFCHYECACGFEGDAKQAAEHRAPGHEPVRRDAMGMSR